MPSYFPPKKNTEYIFYIGLVDQANRPSFKDTPTIAAGDFQVSTDGGALSNLDTIPAVTPASSVMVKFTMSTDEMNGDNVTVVCIDAAGDEWDDLIINIQTAANQLDDIKAETALIVADTDELQTDDIPGTLATIDGIVDDIVADTEDIQSRLPAALVSGRMDSDVGAMQDAVIVNATLATDLDTYQAIPTMVLDANGTINRYGVDFCKNGQPIESGITVPKIQVIKASDGTDLIALTALTEVPTGTGRYKHDESTDVITAGQLYKLRIQATIGGATQVWNYHMWRDA